MNFKFLTLLCFAAVRAILPPDIQEWHLVRCLRFISHRYFSEGHTLVVSLDEDTVHISGRIYRKLTSPGGGSVNVGRHICEEIHNSQSTGIIITNIFAVSGATDWNSHHKYDSYLLLTPSSVCEESHIVQSVESQLKEHSSSPGWNPRARFVVAVTNTSFSYNAEKLSQRILVELWKRKIINGIIVIPVIYVSQSKHARGRRSTADGSVMHVPSLGIYTWFPYRRPYKCSVVDETALLDEWLMAGEGNFGKNSFLFPKKLSDNFHQWGFRVATNMAGLIAETTQICQNKSYYQQSEGFEIRLLNIIIRAMNVTIVLLPTVENFRAIQDDAGNYVGYAGLLINDEADIAIGGIMRSLTSATLLDVTKSYLHTTWEWYVPCPIQFPGWKSIFRIFSPSAWLSILLAAMLANIVVVLFAKFGFNEYESFSRVVDAVMDVWALILGVSVSPLPRTVPLRVFFSAWVCYSLAINTVFQAYLTTFLVDPGLEKSITNLEEMFSSGIKYGFSSLGFDHVFDDKTDPNSIKIIQNRIDCADLVTCILWTAKYRNISSICTLKHLEQLYYSSEYSDELKDYQYCGLKETPVLVTDLLMALQKGSPFLDRMNEIIDRLTENGIIAYLETFNPKTKTIRKTKSYILKSLLDEYSELNMNNMQPAFFLLLFGHFLGLISFLMEMLYVRLYSFLQQHVVTSGPTMSYSY